MGNGPALTLKLVLGTVAAGSAQHYDSRINQVRSFGTLLFNYDSHRSKYLEADRLSHSDQGV